MVTSRDGLPGLDVWLALRRQPGSDGFKVFSAMPRPHHAGPVGALDEHTLGHRDLLPGRQAAAGSGRLRRPQLAGLASPHDPVYAPALFPAAGPAGAQKKQPGLTLYQLAEALKAVPALGRQRLQHGRAGWPGSWTVCRAARSAMPQPPVPTNDATARNSHPNLSLQYCGRLGKVANCQAGVFVAYAGQGGTTLVHRRLFLTEAYAARRQRCGVPEDATFRTKPQLALGMLAELVAAGSLPTRWVSCNEGYGWSGDFLDGVAALRLGYMAEVPVDTRLWPERPLTVVLRRRPGSDGLKVFLCHAPQPHHADPAGTSDEHALGDRDLLPRRQTAAGSGRLRGPQLAGLASPHDPVHAPTLFPAAGPAGAQKKRTIAPVTLRASAGGRSDVQAPTVRPLLRRCRGRTLFGPAALAGRRVLSDLRHGGCPGTPDTQTPALPLPRLPPGLLL